MRGIRCFPRFALPVQYTDLACLCFAIPCGTVPAQPLFLTVLDRHSIAPSCTLLPCRCCLLLGFTHALSCHAIPRVYLSCYAGAKRYAMYCRSVAPCRAVSLCPCIAIRLKHCLCLTNPSHAMAIPREIMLYRCHLHTAPIGFSIAFFCLTHLALVA